jgi:hypothetical protein
MNDQMCPLYRALTAIAGSGSVGYGRELPWSNTESMTSITSEKSSFNLQTGGCREKRAPRQKVAAVLDKDFLFRRANPGDFTNRDGFLNGLKDSNNRRERVEAPSCRFKYSTSRL